MKIKFDIEVDDNIINSLLISAVESGSYGIDQWAHAERRPNSGTGDNLYRGMTVFEDESHEEGKPPVVCVMTDETIAKGLQVMAEKYPKHFSNIVSDNHDAITADVLIQCAMFGELIY
jgi:hypothetical protein